MDDVYGDLENYNDVNVVDELRNENIELKQKIEDYASAMEKLQRDFDELATEFKKLEMNYTSLLKTARAEIERKTQTITNLNIEKDAMVLNAIQNQSYGDYRRLISSRFDPQSNNSRMCKKDTTDCNKTMKHEKAKQVEGKKLSISSSKQDSVINDKNNKLLEYTIPKLTENVKPSSVHSRRKSMSALRCENKFDVSDDEYNRTSNEKRYEKRNTGSHGEHRQSRSKHRSSKGSGSSADDKYSSYKESSLETFYRSKDRYDYDYENRRKRHIHEMDRQPNYSPDRYRKATRHAVHQHKEYRHSDNTQESRYAHRSRSTDHRSYYDTNNDKDYYEGYKHKYLIQEDCNENRNKRIKYSHTTTYPDEQVWQQDTYYTDEELLHKVIGDMQYTSCQSPDLIADNPVHPIPVSNPSHAMISSKESILPYITFEQNNSIISEEIKLIAEEALEDPRLNSRKYSLQQKEDKVILSTVDSKVNLKKCNWNIKQLMLPDALQHPPKVLDISESIETLETTKTKENSDSLPVQDHTNISKSNASSNKDNSIQKPIPLPTKIVSTPIPLDQSKSKNLAVQNKISNVKTPSDHKILSNKESDNLLPMQTVDKVSTKPNNENSNVEDKSIYENLNTLELNLSMEESEVGDLLLIGLDCEKSSNNDKVQHAIKKTKCHKDQIESSKVIELKGGEIKERKTLKEVENRKIIEFQNVVSDSISKKSSNVTSSQEITQACTPKVDTQNMKTINQSHSSDYIKKQTNKEIVAGDLELSDETNDNQDFQKHLSKEPNKTEEKKKEPISEIDIKVIRILSPDEEIKSKGKKRTKKAKVSTRKLSKTTELKSENKTKHNKIINKISSPMKNKFSDLFGDSSSLITPEDLGMGAIQVINNYEPIIEDAQDALDLKENSEPEPVTIQVEQEKLEINDENVEIHNVEIKPVESQVHKEDLTMHKTNVIVHSVPFTQEADVVKTVIISTGTQPQFTNVPNEASHGIHSHNKAVDNTLIALATSTPHKSIHVPIIKLPDDSCISNDSRSSSNAHSVTSLIQASDDVPDVRIFLKRKKKRVIKKA